MDDDEDLLFAEWLAGATPAVAPASQSPEDTSIPAGERPLWRGAQDGEMPTRPNGPGASERVPDLARIARDRWAQALIPLSRRLRTGAAIGRGCRRTRSSR